MIPSLMLKLFRKFTAYDPDLIEWVHEQKMESKNATKEIIHESNIIERQILGGGGKNDT